jgi:hypothetical protein
MGTRTVPFDADKHFTASAEIHLIGVWTPVSRFSDEHLRPLRNIVNKVMKTHAWQVVPGETCLWRVLRHDDFLVKLVLDKNAFHLTRSKLHSFRQHVHGFALLMADADLPEISEIKTFIELGQWANVLTRR